MTGTYNIQSCGSCLPCGLCLITQTMCPLVGQTYEITCSGTTPLNGGMLINGGQIITGDATIPTVFNTGYIDTGIKVPSCNEWKTLQDDEEMLRTVSAKGESVTLDRKNKVLTCTDEYGRTTTMHMLKIKKCDEVVWEKDVNSDG